MELEVRHLRALCAIADAGSLHKAARQLGMSQPSLTTQLRRIENSLGAELFSRDRTGCLPTPLGRSVLSRARPLVADMAALVTETRAAVARTEGPGLRVGSTASRALPGWLRRLRQRLPGTDVGLRVDVSANALLSTVAAGQLDVAFVHEVEGCPLRVPEGLQRRVLVAREPQFVSLARDHPAAASPVVDLADLARDHWMVDPTVDGEWDGLRRVLAAAGIDPPLLHGDYHTAASLIVLGEAVAPCQPTSVPREDMAIRPLRGDPLAVRLLLYARPGTALDTLYAELSAAYREAALRAAPYREWLRRQGASAGLSVGPCMMAV
ncbi:Putative LysR-family transcriptional regulator [Streptomyces venezuelae]|uniref:LysR family transcriptional regulator n=1 Tax=Streptomyces gardneri TaxID=66892 RepID=UPI0007219E11|nr:LysR family transcriptional regulator [Streptomyces gardneri]ALO10977.1 Putative LysR-family transcriptional regulator [Streptomyces venezuelae]QPK47926.1 LysR family transcriptional regulator [Streptomyces gardneri]WRK39379.1 LysR family transcriptional regulator [Streptomyces venezuelae]